MRSFVNRNHKLLSYWCRDSIADTLPNVYAYPDSNPTAMLHMPWATSLRCHSALGVPTATLRCVSCNAMATCFRGDLTALVLSMFKTWRGPRRPWRPYCDLQPCHGALTTTQQRSGQGYYLNQGWNIVNSNLSSDVISENYAQNLRAVSRLMIKMLSKQRRNSYYEDGMVERPSSLYHGKALYLQRIKMRPCTFLKMYHFMCVIMGEIELDKWVLK